MAEATAEQQEQFRASHRYARIAPRKARLVADLVRGRSVYESLEVLRYCHQRGARLIEKLVASGAANAAESGFSKRELFIKEIRVDEGPTLKRWRPRARGRACPIHKRTSHIKLVVAQLGDSEE